MVLHCKPVFRSLERKIMPTILSNRKRCWSSATRILFDCKVTFPVAQHDLRKTFADNRQELAGLGQFVSENLLIKGAELKDVYIKGYASPEGDFNYNKSLCAKTDSNPFKLYFQSISRPQESTGLSYRRGWGRLGRS